MEKVFKRIYTVMGLIGIACAIAGSIISISRGIFAHTNFSILLIIFYVLSLANILIGLFKNNKVFAKIDSTKLTIVRGHVSMMFGFCIFFIPLAVQSNQTFLYTLALIGILIVFMVAMLTFLIGTYTKLNDMVTQTKESEKK